MDLLRLYRRPILCRKAETVLGACVVGFGQNNIDLENEKETNQ